MAQYNQRSGDIVDIELDNFEYEQRSGTIVDVDLSLFESVDVTPSNSVIRITSDDQSTTSSSHPQGDDNLIEITSDNTSSLSSAVPTVDDSRVEVTTDSTPVSRSLSRLPGWRSVVRRES